MPKGIFTIFSFKESFKNTYTCNQCLEAFSYAVNFKNHLKKDLGQNISTAKWNPTLDISGTKWDVTKIVTHFGLYVICFKMGILIIHWYKMGKLPIFNMSGMKWETFPLWMLLVQNGIKLLQRDYKGQWNGQRNHSTYRQPDLAMRYTGGQPTQILLMIILHCIKPCIFLLGSKCLQKAISTWADH